MDSWWLHGWGCFAANDAPYTVHDTWYKYLQIWYRFIQMGTHYDGDDFLVEAKLQAMLIGDALMASWLVSSMVVTHCHQGYRFTCHPLLDISYLVKLVTIAGWTICDFHIKSWLIIGVGRTRRYCGVTKYSWWPTFHFYPFKHLYSIYHTDHPWVPWVPCWPWDCDSMFHLHSWCLIFSAPGAGSLCHLAVSWHRPGTRRHEG